MKTKNIFIAAAFLLVNVLVIGLAIDATEAMPDHAMFVVNSASKTITPCFANSADAHRALPYSQIKSDDTMRSYQLNHNGSLNGSPALLLHVWIGSASSRWDENGFWLY